MNDLFIPLGGANEIGASCYYLQLDAELKSKDELKD